MGSRIPWLRREWNSSSQKACSKYAEFVQSRIQGGTSAKCFHYPNEYRGNENGTDPWWFWTEPSIHVAHTAHIGVPAPPALCHIDNAVTMEPAYCFVMSMLCPVYEYFKSYLYTYSCHPDFHSTLGPFAIDVKLGKRMMNEDNLRNFQFPNNPTLHSVVQHHDGRRTASCVLNW